jgi:hypothetical protein
MDRTQGEGDRAARVAALVSELTTVLQTAVAEHLERWEQAELDMIEPQVQQVFRQLGGVLLGGLARLRVAAQAAQAPVCAQCHGPVRLVERARPRFLQGLVGDVTVRRPYYHCAACQVGTAPLDAAWGLSSGALTPALARVVCRAGIESAFGQAADLVREHLGVQVNEEVVRRATEALGQVAEADQHDRAQWCVPREQVPTILLVELDGVLVHERAAWRELKIVRIAPLGPVLMVDQQSGEMHLALGPSGYAAGLEDADACWQRAMREAWRQGWGRGVRTVVVLGDGAEWIWHQARCQLSGTGVEVVEIVDFYHVCEHLATVATAVFGAGSLRAQDWLAQQRHALRHQGSRPVRRALGKLRPPTVDAAEEVRKARGYFRTHAARMRYPTFRARQFPIGSGAIESTAKNLIQQRQTQAGMRWSERGAQAVASLRALHRSGRWTTFWRSLPQTRLRLLPAGKPAQGGRPALGAAQRPAAPAAPVLSPPPPASPATAPPGAQRIQTTGKVWWQHRTWRDRPISQQRSA